MTEKLTKEFIDEINKQAREQAAKWVVAGGVAMMVFATTGWIFAAKPYIDSYIKRSSGVSEISPVPQAAIVAFDRTPSEPCPAGWTRFKEATSRVIIGAGNGDDYYEEKYSLDENGRKLTPKAYRQHGGEEMVTLSVQNLPAHAHTYRSSFGPNLLDNTKNVNHGRDRYDEMKQHITNSVGGDVAHNNLPPYVALYYCKKS